MKILVPLDGSAFSESVVEEAVKLAKETTAEVHLLSVLDTKHIHQTYAKTPEQNIAAWASSGRDESRPASSQTAPMEGWPKALRRPWRQ